MAEEKEWWWSEGNASYSRESGLDCVKINLHEIEWHNWYLFGEIIFKADETSEPSMWDTEFYPGFRYSSQQVQERLGFPANSDVFQGKDRKSFQ